MLAEIRTGTVSSSDGAVNPARSDKTGATVVTDGHARYAESVIRGGVFIGANPAGTAVTTQAGLSATTPALTLYNPVGSGKNLILNTVTVHITAAPAANAGLMLALNLQNATAPATTTAANTTSALGTTTSPTGQCYRVATLGAAPVAYRYIGTIMATSNNAGLQMIDHVDGEIVLAPGVALSIQATSAVSIVASFTWEEVNI